MQHSNFHPTFKPKCWMRCWMHLPQPLPCCGWTVRSSHRCCITKLFLKILQHPQEIPVLEYIFEKLADLQTCNFIKKGPRHKCFAVNIVKYLILPILKNICKQLLFNFFNGSLLHGPKGLRSRLYDDVRLQGPSYKSTFCFISQHLSPSSKSQPAFENLRLINIFDKTIKFLHWLFLVALVSGCFRWF